MSRAWDLATSWSASFVRLGAGLSVRAPATKRPEQLLQVYEFESCPFCRVVREALTVLDLEAMIYPCPRGSRYRAVVESRGGKAQFPFLVDPNSGQQMYESANIVRYLGATYGGGAPSVSTLTKLGAGLASALRPSRGRSARPSTEPAQPLTLYSFEASPYCRIVRERLCELQLPYHVINVGKRSPHRAAFVERSGRMMVPYLVDPNTDTAMFESADICAYLERTYARGGP